MTKPLITIALAAAALIGASVPAAAKDADAARHTFKQDGVTYSYTAVETAEGRVISGYDHSTGRRFTLRVVASRVDGNYAGQRVSFAAPMPSTEQLAAR